MFRLPRLFIITITAAVTLSSCGEPDPSKLPVVRTPANAKVDLTNISLAITNARIIRKTESSYSLSFDYTITNQTGAHLAFICLYDTTEELIEVNLSDQDEQRLTLGKRPMEGLTLTEPRPLKILSGSTTKTYNVPLIPGLRETGDPITLRVRLHAPSRYDELRSSIEAPLVTIPWP